jgi:hypothetical protein
LVAVLLGPQLLDSTKTARQRRNRRLRMLISDGREEGEAGLEPDLWAHILILVLTQN